jgi:hypothetical protein
MSLTEKAFNLLASEAAELYGERRKIEIEILAQFASAPYRAGVVLAQFDADLSWFGDEDTRCLCVMIDETCKRGPENRTDETAKACRALLRRFDLWDDSDCRLNITGSMKWGPGPLSALFTQFPFDDAQFRGLVKKFIRIRKNEESRASKKLR